MQHKHTFPGRCQAIHRIPPTDAEILVALLFAIRLPSMQHIPVVGCLDQDQGRFQRRHNRLHLRCRRSGADQILARLVNRHNHLYRRRERETVTDALGTTAYTFDARVRLTQQVEPSGVSLTYTYDAVGNRTSIAAPSGATAYLYDVLGRLKTVTDPDGGITANTYGNAGNRTSVTYPNGVKTSYTYDSLNRLIRQENIRADLSTVSSYVYTLGPTGNRVRVVEDTGRTVAYAYDSLYRLVQEDITDSILGNQTIAYTYDPVGNRLGKTDPSGGISNLYDANDRLIAGARKIYTDDANGHRLGWTDGSGSTAYTYDFENNLISAQTSGGTTAYAYDSDGTRINSTLNGVVTEYLVDRNRALPQVLEERDASGSLIARYVYGDDLISQNRGGPSSYYVCDGQLSTRQLMDSSGANTDTYTYDAFGVELARR